MSIGDYKIRNQSGTPWCGTPWCGTPWCGTPWCGTPWCVSSRTTKSEGSSPPHRNSHLDKGIIYFWTATINGWKHLLEKDAYKDIIIDSMGYLSDAGLVDVFAFIIMPNHLLSGG